MIYLAGPIDYYRGDPDARHRALMGALLEAGKEQDIWCPKCEHDPVMTEPGEAIARNIAALHRSDVVVVDWLAHVQPSFGTPIEMWFAADGRRRIIVRGTIGDGLFAQFLREHVVEVETWEQVVAAIPPIVLIADQDYPLISIGGEPIGRD